MELDSQDPSLLPVWSFKESNTKSHIAQVLNCAITEWLCVTLKLIVTAGLSFLIHEMGIFILFTTSRL